MNIQTRDNYVHAIDWAGIIYHSKTIPEFVFDSVMPLEDVIVAFVYHDMSEKLIRKFYEFCNYKVLLSNQKLPLDILQSIISTHELSISDWNVIWERQVFTSTFVQMYISHVNWYNLSTNKHLSEDIIQAYQEHLVWPEVTKHSIHEHILVRYLHRLDHISWTNVSWYSSLSHDFIRKNIDFLDKRVILHTQYVPIDIIQTLVEQDTNLFSIVAKYQKLTLEFIVYYKNFLNVAHLRSNQKIPRRFLVKVYS
ncbi:hypothetical protein EB118_03155 [bacterium]|nr:hypothetical protein [bacterium]NDG29082.1 hypothetical protein [bacterium]